MSEDKTLTCRDCGGEFTFTQGEQDFFAERGFTEPVRCKPCRDSRKAQKSDHGFERSGQRRDRW